MKSVSVLVLGALVCASCATPKFAYKFSTHRYSTASTSADAVQMRVTPPMQPAEWIASSHPDMTDVVSPPAAQPAAREVMVPQREIAAPQPEAKRSWKEQRSASQTNVSKKIFTVNRAQEFDHDLKLAAIFGSVGIVGLLLGVVGEFFLFVGALSLLVGTFFFIRWLLRQ